MIPLQSTLIQKCADDEYKGAGWWFCHVSGCWMHRPWWKVAVNTILRFFQRRGPGDKYVIFTKADYGYDGEKTPITRGYGFGKVWHQ